MNPRDGRNVRAEELYTALGVTGLSSMLRWGFAYGSIVEHSDDPPTGFWAFVRNPFAYFLWNFGMRPPGQKDSSGMPHLNLDQLALPGAVEYDVSLTPARHWPRGQYHQSGRPRLWADSRLE